MATQRDLDRAQRTACLHDAIRKNVTADLRWALDTFETLKERMPKDEVLAKRCASAWANLRTSERLTNSEPH